MIEQHINEADLRNKILSLFEYRLFPQLMLKSTESGEHISQFTEDLVQLQAAIYYLDAHLEAHWQTDEAILSWHWRNIIKHLNIFGIDNKASATYLNHIKKYEKHELDLRKGKTPLRLDMEYFYFYKSCDVKLLRRLIYEKYKLSPEYGQLSDWRYYDLVTEVNDDVEDLYEDLDFINGNRFLISILHHGKQKTKVIFDQFLQIIEDKSIEKYQNTQGKMKEEIYVQTRHQISETRNLLDLRLESVTRESLHRSELAKYMISKDIVI